MTTPRPRILAIDDTPANLQLLMAALTLDFDLQVATSGAQGLEYASQAAPDLILLDVMMPEMDGFEVCRRVKADARFRDIPIIFLTALGDVQAESTGLALGAADCITKPVNVAIAQHRIRNLLEREALRKEIQTQFNELKQATDLLQASRQRELEFGNAIQHTLLQGVIPKGIEGASVSSFSEPSQVVDGDFSDIRRLHTNSFDVLVGDVMGKGVGAALIGAGVRSAYHQVLADLQVIKTFGTVLPTPQQIVNRLHRELTPRLAELSSFVTLALYRFDLEAGTLTCVNAGHTPGLLLSAKQGQLQTVMGENLPLGVLPDEVYVEVCVPIGPGDRLLVYSDGITEARSAGGEQFGQERLIAAFEAGRAAALAPFALLDSLQQSLKGFTGGAPALDDQTAIIVEWPSHGAALTRPAGEPESTAQTMRRRSEAVARNFLSQASHSDRSLSPEETQRVLYELRVHQVELEMQNDELRATQLQLDTERERYFDLYDLAPVGYLSVSEQGLILQANLSAASLLGETRKRLEKQLLNNFIAPSDQDTYFLLRRQLLDSRQPQACELQMMPKAGQPLWVKLSVNLAQDGNAAVELRIVISDISERKRTVLALQDSEQRFRQLFHSNSTVMLLIEPGSGRIIDANAAAANYYGYPAKQLIRMSINDINTLSPQAIKQEMEQAERQQRSYFLFQHRLASGEVCDVEVHSTPISVGSQTLLMSIVHDISTRVRLARELDQVMLEQAAILNSDIVGMFKLRDRKVVWTNAAFAKMLGYTADELIGRSTRMFYPSDEAFSGLGAEAYPVIEQGPIYRAEVEFRCKDGAQLWLQMDGSLLQAGGSDSIWSFIDITQRKRMEDQIRQLAFYDPLTGLPNRRLLTDRLNHALSAGKRTGRYAALMFLDLDNFKPLNDAHGHGVGDLLLVQVAQRLLGCVREVDTVARMGGDEFIVLMGELDASRSKAAQQARSVAEKVRASLATPYQLSVDEHDQIPAGTLEHHCSASIGVVVFLGAQVSQEDVLKWADAAMYRAKDAGRNSVQFHEEKR